MTFLGVYTVLYVFDIIWHIVTALVNKNSNDYNNLAVSLLSYYKTRSAYSSVCAQTPPPFTGRQAPNLAGILGTGSEIISRAPFPWKPMRCHSKPKKCDFYGQIRISLDIKLPMTSWLTHGWRQVVNDVTLVVISWKRLHIDSISALFWSSLWWLKMLLFCQFVQVRVRLDTPLAVRYFTWTKDKITSRIAYSTEIARSCVGPCLRFPCKGS